MNLILITLAVVAFVVCLTLIDWLAKRYERVRTARQWEERERLLDRRRPAQTSAEVRQRRARRH